MYPSRTRNGTSGRGLAGACYGTRAFRNMISHGELTGVAVLVVIGAVLNRASVSEAAFAVRLTPVSINHIDGQSPYRRSGVPACPLIVCARATLEIYRTRVFAKQ